MSRSELDDARRELHLAYVELVDATYSGTPRDVIAWADTLQDVVDQLVEAYKRRPAIIRSPDAAAERVALPPSDPALLGDDRRRGLPRSRP